MGDVQQKTNNRWANDPGDGERAYNLIRVESLREALENRSTTVRMAVLPSDRGRHVTKSRDICETRYGEGQAVVEGELAEESCSVHRSCMRR